jgi:hypothetical protein
VRTCGVVDAPTSAERVENCSERCYINTCNGKHVPDPIMEPRGCQELELSSLLVKYEKLLPETMRQISIDVKSNEIVFDSPR